MNPISIKLICDFCGWTDNAELQNARDHHNRPCPACGKVYINDHDMEVLSGILQGVDAGVFVPIGSNIGVPTQIRTSDHNEKEGIHINLWKFDS